MLSVRVIFRGLTARLNRSNSLEYVKHLYLKLFDFDGPLLSGIDGVDDDDDHENYSNAEFLELFTNENLLKYLTRSVSLEFNNSDVSDDVNGLGPWRIRGLIRHFRQTNKTFKRISK